MKKIFLAGFSCLIFSLLLLLTSADPAKTPELQREVASWAMRFLELSRNPLWLPWRDEVAHELRASGLLDRYGSWLSTDLAARLQREIQAATKKSFTLTFPHSANGQGGGLIIQSNIILINNSETNANGAIFLRKTDGSSMTVKTNQGTGSSFDFSLLPGQTYRLETDGTGAVTVGWIEVISDIQLSGSGTFALFDSSRQFLSEVGIGDSPLSKSVMIFVDTTEGRNTAYAVSNPSRAAAARLKLQLKKLDGTPVAIRENVTLGPLNQKSEFVTETFAGTDLRDFRGILLITTTDTEIAATTLRTRGVRFTSLPSAAQITDTSAKATLLFARIGDGIFGSLKFQASSIFMNNSDKKANVTLELFKSDGTAMELVIGGTRASRFVREVPAGGALELLSDGSTSPGAVGWARATSDIPISGGGTFVIKSSTGEFISEVGVPSSLESSKLSMLVQVAGTIDTGFGLTNIDSFAKTVTLRLIGSKPDRVLSEKNLSLGSLGHDGRFVSEIFSDVPEIQQRDFEGRLEAESFGITAITLRTRGAFLTSLPVARLNRAAFAPKLNFAAATLLEGSQPYFCLNFSQDAGEAPMAKATVRFDKGSIDFSKITKEGQEIGVSIQRALGILFIGRMFVTGITSNSARLYTVVTTTGVGEGVPFMGTVSNIAGGGVQFSIEMSPVASGPVPVSLTSSLCFDAGLLKVPSALPLPLPILPSTTVKATEEYESFEQTLGAEDILKRSATSSITTTTLSAGLPRIAAVTPTRTVSATDLTVSGNNFSPDPAGNVVTVEGNSRIGATVLEASPNTLKIRLPENAVTGNLRVEVGGQASNNYALNIFFGPRAALSFAALGDGASAALNLKVSYKTSQIDFMDVALKPAQGTWMTSGFSSGDVLGTMKIDFISPFSGTVSQSVKYDVKVKSSAADKLLLDLLKQDSGSRDFKIELTNTGGASLLLSPSELSFTTESRTDISLELAFTKPIFKLPAGTGTSYDVNVEITSMPERTKLRGSARTAVRKFSFRTS